MFESFLITLREGVEAALILGITLLALRKIGRRDLQPFVYAGLSVAIVASLVVGIVLPLLPLNPELFEGILQGAAALVVGSLLLWMWRIASQLKSHIEQRVSSLVWHRGKGTQPISSSGLGLGLFTFLMIFREGFETVLFLAAVSFNTQALLSFLGGLIGLLIAILFAILFIRGGVHFPLKPFFQATTLILAILVIQLGVNSYHELAEAEFLPANSWTMAIVGPLVKWNALFLLAILIVPLVLVILRAAPSPPSDISPQVLPGQYPSFSSPRSWRYGLAIAISLIVLTVGAGLVYTNHPGSLDPPLRVAPRGEVIRIPLVTLNGKGQHRFLLPWQQRSYRFFVVRNEQEEYVAALEACPICGVIGYSRKGSVLICENCDAEIPISLLGTRGGCTPLPLETRIDDHHLTIPLASFLAHQDFFLEMEQGGAATAQSVGEGTVSQELQQRERF